MRVLTKHLPLLPILLAATLLRLFGQNWDDGGHLHPDERFIAMVEAKITLPRSPGEYFDTAHSPLNPYNNDFGGFAYGTLPLFFSRWLGQITGSTGYDGILPLGRTLSALADIGTVVFVYALANLLYGRRAAITASAVSAFSVLDIQLSHFFAFDTFATFFVAWSLFFAYRTWMMGGLANMALLGIGVGFAVACKISTITLAPIVLLACVLPWRGRGWPALPAVGGSLATIGVVTLLSYRLAEPYAFLGTSLLDFRPNPKFVADMLYWIKVSSGELEVPYMIQWANTPKYTFVLGSIFLWGLGPAAALSGLAGLLLAAVQLRAWRRHGRHVLLVVWALINLVYFGGQFAKFMRYLLPVYPALAVLAGYFLGTCWDTASRFWRHPVASLRWPARATAAVPILVVFATFGWAIAFVQIYTQPNSRVTASRWLLDNLPKGAVLALEHWDDALPLALPGRDSKGFQEVSMNLYDDENPEKLKKLLDNLNKADYVILASNRLYGSIPRLPQRYPLATEYYRALFDGRLGYELVAQFTSRPRLFGLEIVDDGAQEDFTVYDHPKIQVFRKAADYDPSRTAGVLGAVSLDNVQHVKALEGSVGQAPLLTPQEWATAQAGGTWSALFHSGDLANRFALPLWWAAASLLGLVVWPILWRLTPHLADRGFGLSRTLGVLMVAYASWLLASLKIAPFGRTSLLAVAAALALASALLLRSHGAGFRRYLRTSWPALMASEAAFTVGFLVCLWMRLVNPDLWHPAYGGEKPMDFAYLNAIIKSDYFPPYDPWFASGSINYYYFGWVLVAALVKLTGIVPATAYNLALILWFGLLCQTAFSVAFNLILRDASPERPRRWVALAGGTLAVLFVALVGNLDGAIQLRDALWKASSVGFQSGIPVLAGLVRALAGLLALARGARGTEFDFWRSTRVIGPEEPGPITEFPFFSFLYADLHAHLLALPLTLMVLGLSVEVMRSDRLRGVVRGPFSPAWPRRSDLVRFVGLLLLLGLGVGALRATNTWDFPTYLAVVLLALACLLRPLGNHNHSPLVGPILALFLGGLVFGASSLLFAPYVGRYQLFYSGVDPAPARTLIWQFLTINGLWIFALASYFVLELRRRSAHQLTADAPRLPAAPGYYNVALPMPLDWSLGPSWRAGAFAVVLSGLALGAIGLGTLGVTMVLGVGLAVLASLRWRSRDALFGIGLALLALAVLALPDVLTIKGDIGRMNTVFKFYLQAWTILALLSAVWLARLISRAHCHWPFPLAWRRLWLGALALLLAAVAIYPLRAAPVKLASRFGPLPLTLDGMAFMQKAAYRDRDQDADLPSDYAALRWLQDNVEGSPVVLEANTGLYKWGSRVSIYTGLPTVVGWDWHEKQQRVAMAAAVDERLKDVKTMFESTRLEQALPLLRRYGVAYIYVGGLERMYYPAGGLKKFEEAPRDVLQPVYERGDVTIYRVMGVS